MSPSAADLGPVRLRALATAAKLEALVLASEWGTPLTPILSLLAEAFQGPLAEVADQVIRGWEAGTAGGRHWLSTATGGNRHRPVASST
jgi:hypothetical protein